VATVRAREVIGEPPLQEATASSGGARSGQRSLSKALLKGNVYYRLLKYQAFRNIELQSAQRVCNPLEPEQRTTCPVGAQGTALYPLGCQVGVVPFSVARHSLIVFVPRLTSRDISSRSDFAFNPAVEGGRRSCGSPPKLRIRKCLSCGKRAAVPRILHAVNSSCAVALHKILLLPGSFSVISAISITAGQVTGSIRNGQCDFSLPAGKSKVRRSQEPLVKSRS
jgi:hypothetical protein